MVHYLEEGLRALIGYLVPLVESFGALVVMLGATRAIVRYLRGFLGHSPVRATSLRIELGQSMVMGLEFLVAADILRTALSPAWNDMLLLAALVGLRVVLNYSLERELRALDRDAPPSANDQPASAPAGQGGEGGSKS